MLHDRLLSHMTRHDPSSLNCVLLERSHKILPPERGTRSNCQRIAEIHVLGPRNFLRRHQYVLVGSKTLVPVLGIVTSDIDKTIQFANLMDSKASLQLCGPEIVPVRYEQKPGIDPRMLSS